MNFLNKIYEKFSLDTAGREYLKKHKDEFIELSGHDLYKLQKCLLEMLKDIHMMCLKNKIDYALTGGNVLGKIRHNGFIPWDDDIDLIMMREDYEKFKKIFKDSSLQNGYILKGPGCRDGADYRCMKIYKKNTVMEPFLRKKNAQEKIFIDVMPFDYVPDSQLHRKLTNLWCVFLIVAIGCIDFKLNYSEEFKKEVKHGFTGVINYLCRTFFGTLFNIVPLQTWYKWYDRAPIYLKRTKYGTVYNGKLLYMDEIVPVDYYYPFKDCEYCGVKTRIIHKPEKYLEFRYGDYMKVPDKANRGTHAVRKISVGD